MTARLRPLTAREARWATGFWGDVHERTRRVTVPRMWDSLSDPAVSPALRNFEMAAGTVEGTHEGPPFMDGDFYKWLEAAVTQLETDPDPWLADTVERVTALIASVQREDGYLHTPTLIAARNHEQATALADRFHFETYNLGHLITVGVRHHEVTGSTTLLDVARGAAAFLEHLAADEPLELARSAICPSHYMAVIELYRRPARGATSTSPRRSSACATTSPAAMTTRTACPSVSRPSSPGTRCARTTSTPASRTWSPRPATPNSPRCSSACGPTSSARSCT